MKETMSKYTPNTKDELRRIIVIHFENRIYDLNDIDTSEITDMSCLFKSFGMSGNFNVSKWDTGKVENMEELFRGCPNFNCDLGKWNTENVRNMSKMFYGCSKFNSNIGSWNVKNVIDMSGILSWCSSFNQDLSMWNIEKVMGMHGMFSNCYHFNQDLSSWNIRGKDCSKMFNSCYRLEPNNLPKYLEIYDNKI